MRIDFKEEQKFTQWWLWIILIGTGIVPFLGIYKQLILGEKIGDKPMSDFGLILFCVFIFGIIAMFWSIKLKTEIDQHEIRIDYYPFIKKRIKWTEIKTFEILNYEFVGWGIHISTKYGTVFNATGNKGLFIELLNGKKFLVGTQLEKELRTVMQKKVQE
jgi:hypothetical protein